MPQHHMIRAPAHTKLKGVRVVLVLVTIKICVIVTSSLLLTTTVLLWDLEIILIGSKYK